MFLMLILMILGWHNVFNFGGFSPGVTPLPIPNRAVKPRRADGTACAGVWESRSLPNLNYSPDFFSQGFFVFKVKGVWESR
jgi:hypothetical protein